MTLKRNLVLPIVGLVVLLAVVYLVWGGGNGDPAEKYLKVEVERGDVRRTVTSTGTLQAVVTVQVGSQVSGRIQELHADFNSVVKKGQRLAIIDPANFEAQRDRAAASLATSEAAVKNAEANLINRQGRDAERRGQSSGIASGPSGSRPATATSQGTVRGRPHPRTGPGDGPGRP